MVSCERLGGPLPGRTPQHAAAGAVGVAHLRAYLYVGVKERAHALFSGGPIFCGAIPLGEAAYSHRGGGRPSCLAGEDSGDVEGGCRVVTTHSPIRRDSDGGGAASGDVRPARLALDAPPLSA